MTGLMTSIEGDGSALVEKPMFLAAYRVLTEQSPPMNCTSIERLQEVLHWLGLVRKWADLQDRDVMMAYISAATAVEMETKKWLRNHTDSFASQQIYNQIAKPPHELKLIPDLSQ